MSMRKFSRRMGEQGVLASLSQVRALVPDSIFKRAKELSASNKVHSISFQGPGLQTSTAFCTGSSPSDNYNISILINAESPSKPMCQCSCPAALKAKANMCKHVVALLLLRMKELAKTTKEMSVLQEFKQAEDALAGDKKKESTFSDSQATELFVPSDNKPKLEGEETTATASSVSPVIRNNQKRVLPSWISGGFGVAKKEVKEKVARKSACKQGSDEEDGSKAWEGNETKQAKGGRAKSRFLNKNVTAVSNKSISRKRKDAGEETSHSTEAEDSLDGKPEQNYSCKTGRANMQRNIGVSAGKGSRCPPKRRRTRGYIESDLSEEDEPEVFDKEDCPFELKEDPDLTTDDLINLAKEHLETEKSGIDHEQSCENAKTDEASNEVALPKKKGSIFSVQGWNEIASKSLDGKEVPFRQEASEMPVLPSTFTGEPRKGFSQTSAEFGLSDGGLVNAKSSDSLQPAENIVDDMLGLLFGPTLSKTVNLKVESTQDFAEAMANNSLACSNLPETNVHDEVLPPSIDSLPKPKKKGSLKDKVMMLLG